MTIVSLFAVAETGAVPENQIFQRVLLNVHSFGVDADSDFGNVRIEQRVNRRTFARTRRARYHDINFLTLQVQNIFQHLVLVDFVEFGVQHVLFHVFKDVFAIYVSHKATLLKNFCRAGNTSYRIVKIYRRSLH